jgi:hypothetical protein
MRKVLILIAFLLFSLIFSGLVGAPEGKIKEELLQYLEAGEVERAVEQLWEWEKEIPGVVEETLEAMVWEPLLGGAGINYTVVWEQKGNLLWPRVSLPETICISVPVDPVQRFLAWYGLSGADVVWVAQGSTAEKARASWEQGILDLSHPITILLSCPAEDYKDQKTRDEWNNAVAQLRALSQRLENMGVEVELADLSDKSANDAVEEVKKRLLCPGAQVLGFFHRGTGNAFEVGQGGTFGLAEIKEVGAKAREQGIKPDFVTTIGCNSLLFGLNDAFIEEGLTNCTFAVAPQFNARNVYNVIETFLRFIETQRKEGKITLPLKELKLFIKVIYPDVQQMGKISKGSYC